MLLTLLRGSASAQEAPLTEVRDPGLSVVAAGLTAAAPRLLHINERPSECGPCDPTTIPAFDRWAVRSPVDSWSTASDVVLLGLGFATWLDLARQDRGLRRVVVSVESAAWAMAVTQVTKAVVGRKRPILYTPEAPLAADAVGNRRSFPSGHSALAFALATSYWLNGAGDRGPEHWIAFGGATFVAVARVTSAEHFPSDAVAGAVIGAATAIVIHEIRF